jgi:hypothetical protein
MKIFSKESNKDIAKRMENLDQKLDLIHKSVARLRIDLPQVILKDIENMEGFSN